MMISFKKFLCVAVCLGCLSSFGGQQTAGIWGNTSSLWSKLLPDNIKTQKFAAQLPPVEKYKEYPLNIISNIGKSETFSSENLKMLHEYLENGGVLLVDGSASIIFSSSSNFRDLSRAESILGARYYGYGAFDSNIFPAANRLFGEEADKFNAFRKKIRIPLLCKTTSMQIIYGKDNNALLGYNRVGKGLFIYCSWSPRMILKSAEAKEMVKKLVTLALDTETRDKIFPAVDSSAFAFWGNTYKRWMKVADGKISLKRIVGKRPSFKLLSRYPVAVISFFGNSGVVFTDDEINEMKEYLKSGGVLLFDYASIVMFRSKKSISDLSRGATIMGAGRYGYGAMKSNVMPLAKEIFGKETENIDIYAGMRERKPMLAGIQGMKVIFGSDKFANLGVNRYGKGAFIYNGVLGDNNNPAYGGALLKLFEIVRNPVLLDKYFPVPPSNELIKHKGELKHLSIAPGSDPRAAKLFKDKLGLMSDKKDLSARDDEKSIILHIGQDQYVQNLKLDFKKLHQFGYYIIFKDGKNIVLAGKSDQANRYAVIDFLKRYAGYRQYGNSKYSEITPKIEHIALPGSIDLREEPDIASYVVAWNNNNDFGRNYRLTCLSTHSMFRLVPPEKYGKTHPEYFPMVKGKRIDMSKCLAHGTWNPCLKNPNLDKLTADYADRYFKKKPDMLGLPFGVNDGLGDCQCPYCLNLAKKYTNRYAPFYNSSAKVLSKKYPGKLLAFIAYGAAREVPKNIKMEPNILVEITGMGQNPFNEMEKWRKAGIKNFGLYTYLYSEAAGYVTPRYYPEIMAKAWRDAYKKYNLTTIWEEYYPASTIFSAPRQYVLDEVAWNVDVDAKKLLEEYFSNMYAESAAPVKQFFERLEEIYCRKKDPKNPIADWKNVRQIEEYTFADLKYLDSQMAQALKLAKTPQTKWRMDILNKAYQLFRCNISSFLNSRVLRDAKNISSVAQAQKLIKAAEQGYKDISIQQKFTLSPEEEKIIFIKKNGLKNFKNQSRVAPLPILEKQVDKVFNKITGFLLKNKSKDEVRKFWLTSAAGEPGLNNFKVACLSQIYMMDNKPVNLIKNSGFEPANIKDTSAVDRKRHDWSTIAKNLRGWSCWHFQNSVTRFFWDSTVKHSGKYSVGIGENQVNGCILTGASLKPDCRYKFSFYVMRNDDNGGKLGEFSVRMKGKGGWLDRGSAIGGSYPPECVGKWVKMEVTFSAPPFKAAAMPLLAAPVQRAGSRIWFDDVKLEKIYDPDVVLKKK
jgi:hypothetical protein